MRRSLLSATLAALLLSPGALLAQGRPQHDARLVAMSRDELQAPAFFWGDRRPAQASDFAGAALEHLARQAGARLPAAALASARAARVLDTGRGGVVVVVRQSVEGVELFEHDAKVMLDRQRRLVAVSGGLHQAAFASPRLGRFSGSASSATAAALADMVGAGVTEADLEERGAMAGGYRAFGPRGAVPGGYRLRVARARPVYFPLRERLIPAHFVEIDATASDGHASAYAYVVAADGRGEVLYRSTLTHDAGFSYRVWAETGGDKRPLDGPVGDYTPYPGATPLGSKPAPAEPALVSIDGFNKFNDPWLPEGATETQGNNVDAYTDDDQPDGFSSADVRASATAPGVFDHTYDPGKGPQSSDPQRMASVTSVFYTVNWLHDWWYDSGFDEEGGNAQKSNYDRGGYDNDVLLAEAQNGAPFQRNNANMSAFGDGLSPRMQMFVWQGQGGSASLKVGKESKQAGLATFGPQDFELTGEVALVDDGADPKADACEPVVNDVKGKIALIERGTCTFVSKAKKAQEAGAVGMILYDNKDSGPPPTMPGDEQVDIPSLSIRKSDGEAMIASLAKGPVTVSMKQIAAVDLDGTIDNTVVTHEWGHYLHLRHVNCGSAMCFAESEGWGDFTALTLVLREGDDLDGTFPLSQYASQNLSSDGFYFGIRRYPYSTDQSKNPLTFKHIARSAELPDGPPRSPSGSPDNAEAHAAGEVWATMLHEAYVALLKRSQGPGAPYTFDQARRRMSDYVVQGLTLAPTNPTYTEQRDAILAAASASDAEDVKVMVEAFARRGAGTCAVSPPRDSVDFEGIIESFESQPSVNILSITVDDSEQSCDNDGRLDAGEAGKVRIKLRNVGTSEITGTKVAVTSDTKGAFFPAGKVIEFPPIPAFEVAEGTLDVALSPSLSGIDRLKLSVAIEGVVTCEASSKQSAALLINFDEIETGAAVDSVEASTSTFVAKGKSSDKVWSRLDTSPDNHVWAGIDYGSPSDTHLLSPAIEASETEPLILSFKHRHQFETSEEIFWDGAVIEYSINNGAKWFDLSDLADPGYNGTIGDPQGLASNNLRNRPGFVDRNPSFPDTDQVTIDLGNKLAGKTVRFRFRIGTDDAAGGLGWQLDEIGVQGALNAPFSGIVDNQTPCALVQDPAGAGGQPGQAGTAGSPAAGQAGSKAASAGSGGTGGAAGAGGQAGAAPAAVSPLDLGGGCDCRAARAPSPAGGASAVLLALAAMGRRGRRPGLLRF